MTNLQTLRLFVKINDDYSLHVIGVYIQVKHTICYFRVLIDCIRVH
jgi:hypothetical protein